MNFYANGVKPTRLRQVHGQSISIILYVNNYKNIHLKLTDLRQFWYFKNGISASDLYCSYTCGYDPGIGYCLHSRATLHSIAVRNTCKLKIAGSQGKLPAIFSLNRISILIVMQRVFY